MYLYWLHEILLILGEGQNLKFSFVWQGKTHTNLGLVLWASFMGYMDFHNPVELFKGTTYKPTQYFFFWLRRTQYSCLLSSDTHLCRVYIWMMNFMIKQKKNDDFHSLAEKRTIIFTAVLSFLNNLNLWRHYWSQFPRTNCHDSRIQTLHFFIGSTWNMQ